MSKLDHDLLDEDPESQAIDADEDAYYEPFIEDNVNVVVTEPDVISIGRGKRHAEMRKVRNEQGKGGQ